MADEDNFFHKGTKMTTTIEAKDYKWKYRDAQAAPCDRYLPGSYRIPDGVTVRFPNGDEYDSTGGPDGPSETDTAMEGSPVYQALVDAGWPLEKVR